MQYALKKLKIDLLAHKRNPNQIEIMKLSTFHILKISTIFT